LIGNSDTMAAAEVRNLISRLRQSLRDSGMNELADGIKADRENPGWYKFKLLSRNF